MSALVGKQAGGLLGLAPDLPVLLRKGAALGTGGRYAEPAVLGLHGWETPPAPEEFLDTKSPLFEPKRAPPVNAGGKLPQQDTDVDKALVLSSYLDAELNVEEGVHGNVHCDVGGRRAKLPGGADGQRRWESGRRG